VFEEAAKHILSTHGLTRTYNILFNEFSQNGRHDPEAVCHSQAEDLFHQILPSLIIVMSKMVWLGIT
jgi:hypothetical protein